MKTTIYNVDQIVSIDIVSRKVEPNYVYISKDKKPKGFWECLFNKTLKKGWYWTGLGFSGPYSDEDLKNGKVHGIKHQIFGGKVYYRPYVRICFSDGSKIIEVFDSEDLIRPFLENNKIQINKNFELKYNEK